MSNDDLPPTPSELDPPDPTVPLLDDGSHTNSMHSEAPNGNGQNPDSSYSAAWEMRQMPSSIEAEQALLGAILIDNEAYWRASEILSDDHFYDPMHARIFQTMSEMVRRNQLVTPVTMAPYFENDETLKQIGGTAYFAKLASAAPTIMNAPEYARTVFEQFQRRGLIHVGEDIVTTAINPSIETSPSEQIQDAERTLYELAENARYEGGFSTFAEAAEISVGMAEEAFKSDGSLLGVTTGFIDLDRQLGGLHKSDLIILAGRPSMGKTALATNIAFNAARKFKEGKNPDGTRKTMEGAIVAFYSLEMAAEQLATRILAEQAQIPSIKMRRGEINEEEFRQLASAQRELQNLPLFIDDTGGLSISALTARARRLQRQHGLDMVIVDYLQLVTTSSRRNDGRVQEVSEVTQGLKALAKELNVPVIALSQLSRKVEDRDDKRPQLADLRESGSIEQDADVVMFVYREEYYVERTKPSEAEIDKFVEWEAKMERTHGLAELVIGKQRHGPTGTVEMSFQADITRFGDKARQDYPDEGRF